MIAASEISGSKHLIWISFIIALFVQTGLGALLWQVCGAGAEVSRKIVPLVSLKLQPNFAIQPPVLSQPVNKAEPKQVLPHLPANIMETTKHEPSPDKQVSVKILPDILEPQHLQPKIKQQAQKQPQKQTPKIYKKQLNPRLRTVPEPVLRPATKSVAEMAKVALPVDVTVQKIVAASKSAILHSNAVPVRQIEPVKPEANTALSQSKSDSIADASSEPPIVSKAMQDEFSRYLARIRKQLEKNKKYPDNARRKRIEGNVLVSFSILSDGQIDGVKIINSAAVELSAASLALLRGQKFPAPPSGWQSGSRIEFTINYNLR